MSIHSAIPSQQMADQSNYSLYSGMQLCAGCALLSASHPRRISLRCDLLLVGVDVPVKFLDLAGITNPKAGADVLQHRHVVRHHQHAPLEFLQGPRKRIHRLDI